MIGKAIASAEQSDGRDLEPRSAKELRPIPTLRKAGLEFVIAR
jgi:hypothetical protein